MNNKKTNYFIAIMNVILMISIYVSQVAISYLQESIIPNISMSKSIYDSIIIDTLLNLGPVITVIICILIGIINTICAFQNKDDKKLSFWQLIFGIYLILSGINVSNLFIYSELLEWVNMILYGIIPIILAVINLILIKKNKPNIIQIISYILVILLSISYLCKIIENYWGIMISGIIIIIMQLIYTHNQEKNVIKNKKIVNTILYYIIETIIVVGFLVMIIMSLVIGKVNEISWKNQTEEIFNKLSTLQGATNNEMYISTEKNNKYGFINEKGKEKIPCEYEKISSFYSVNYKGKQYYFALAKKENNYYIITKSNEKIDVSNNKYLKTLSNYLDYKILVATFIKTDPMAMPQEIMTYDSGNIIELEKQKDKFYYKNSNYTMFLELIESKEDDQESDYQYYDSSNENWYYTDNDYNDNYYIDENDFYQYSNENDKFKVTIRKENDEESSNIEYLPTYNQNCIETFSDGSIYFKDLKEEKYGWYDTTGTRNILPKNYQIEDILENGLMFLKKQKNGQIVYLVANKNGKILLESETLYMLKDSFVIKNENKKMVLYDKDLNKLSDEYDNILINKM